MDALFAGDKQAEDALQNATLGAICDISVERSRGGKERGLSGDAR